MIFQFFLCCWIPLTSASTHYSKQPEVTLGTTLVAHIYQDGVILGADSRTSVGTYVSHRAAEKLVPLTDHAVVARSGSAAATQGLVLAAKEHVLRQDFLHERILSASQLAFWLKNHIPDACGLLIAGYDTLQQKPVLYTTMSGGLLLPHSHYATAGSGSPLATGVLDALPNKNVNREEAIQRVKMALCVAMGRDASSGGICRFVDITQEGTKSWDSNPTSFE